MQSTIRSATLIGYPELARSIGLDPDRLMRRCGLNPSCLADPDLRVDATAVAKLLETSAAESGVEDFGLRLSTARRLSNLGPFSLVVREETTARRALETLGRYLQLHSELLSNSTSPERTLASAAFPALPASQANAETPTL